MNCLIILIEKIKINYKISVNLINRKKIRTLKLRENFLKAKSLIFKIKNKLISLEFRNKIMAKNQIKCLRIRLMNKILRLIRIK
jgi:hypothetical protein